ncbi:MAG: hypothetical protein MUF19_01395 [Candidatus Pacebacteria bacterium]|nr:hypothetical protein [Candidatus Paceibacterota bacterium]
MLSSGHYTSFTHDGVTSSIWWINADIGKRICTRDDAKEEDERLWETSPEDWCKAMLQQHSLPNDQAYNITNNAGGHPTIIKIQFKSDTPGYGTTRSRRKAVQVLASSLQAVPAAN